ncbi:MAG: hypothetical protein AAFV85_18210 [Cyanobacteria bacterium J06634_6]
MTNGTPADIESRLSRLEEIFVSAGEYITHTSQLAQANTEAIDRNIASIDVLIQRMDRLTQTVDRVVNRIDSLTAASERHDRILDYLLGQQTNDG